MLGKCPTEILAFEGPTDYYWHERVTVHFCGDDGERTLSGRRLKEVTATSLPLNFFMFSVMESCLDFASLSFFSRCGGIRVGLRN